MNIWMLHFSFCFAKWQPVLQYFLNVSIIFNLKLPRNYFIFIHSYRFSVSSQKCLHVFFAKCYSCLYIHPLKETYTDTFRTVNPFFPPVFFTLKNIKFTLGDIKFITSVPQLTARKHGRFLLTRCWCLSTGPR